jgi:hypothetical protein
MPTTRSTLSWRRTAALVLTLATPLASAACIDAVIGDIEVCKYDGKGYSINESFPATDGCNTCTCDKTGSVSCTEIACNHDAGAAPGGGGADGGSGSGSCSHGGRLYEIGETFKDSDGCNTCSCTAQGVACTLIACGGTCKDGDKVYHTGQSFPASDGCNSCTCGSDGSIACTEKACSNPCAEANASDLPAGLPLPPACGVCSYGGQSYREGDSFPAADGCNSCRCGANGSVGCTKIACPGGGTCEFNGKIYQVGDTFRDELDCNGCSCTESGVACTRRYCDPGLACTLGDRRFASGVSVLCSDGCNSCLCNAGSWTSTDRACQPLPKVERCSGVEAGAPKARVLYLDGDALALEVGMGGCADTTPAFKLCFDGSFAESFPVQTRLRIVADEPSACSAWTTQEQVIDLTPLRDAYRSAYQTSSGAISVGLPGDSVVYMF